MGLIKKRMFDGKEYFLYGRGDNNITAKVAGKAVRESGGRARVVGLEIWARKTDKWNW